MDDLHRPPAEDIGRTDHHRIADARRDLLRLRRRKRRAIHRLAQPEAMQKPLEAAAILSEIDGIRRASRGSESALVPAPRRA